MLTSTATQIYTWNGYRCTYDRLAPPTERGVPLLLIHPIGVGLSRQFWQRFCAEWRRSELHNPIYNPDLLGCGESDMPHFAFYPADWAEQLDWFLQTVVQTPVVLVVQGALLPVAIELVQRQPDLIRGLVLSGPPAWALLTRRTPDWQHRLSWNLLDSPIGSAFYRYARRSQFLRSFSTRQLFATEAAVDAEWLEMLQHGAHDPASRHAVFSFLASFWRQDYAEAIQHITQPTLIVLGEQASSISREGKQETLDQRLSDYQAAFPNAHGVIIPGRNVLPYESTHAFVQAMAPFVQRLDDR